jgi:predicted DNA-binding transcriptional regulator AlpA
MNSANEVNKPEPLITRRELAKLCKVSTRTVDNWVASNSVPVLRSPSGGSVRFLWSEVYAKMKTLSAK